MRKQWIFASLGLALSMLVSGQAQTCLAQDAATAAAADATQGAPPSPATPAQPQPNAAQPAAPQNMKYTLRGKEITKGQYQALILFNESYALMLKGDYAGSAAKLEAALANDPNLYQARTNYGFVLGRLGRADEGIAQLKKALELDPQRPEAITTIASMYQATGKLDDAIAEYKLVMQRHPNHVLAPNIKSVIKQLEEVVRRDKEVAKTLGPDQGKDDYFAHATYDSVAKWNASHIPLKIYVPPVEETKNIAHFKPEFSDAFKQSFKEWQDASQNAFTFKYVDKQSESDIDVLWTADPTKVSRPSEGGEARVAYDTINGISHVQIILLTKLPDGSEGGVPLNIIKAACLHEIGHSLGILGHSPDPNDVMFCSVPAADQPHPLTTRDGKTLAHLYQPDVKMAHHFHDVADASDKISLNNEGVNYAGSQQFAKAAEKFEAALKLDPSYEPAKQNLGACLNNLAIEAARANKFPEAAAKFKRSLDLMANSKDRERTATTMRNYAFVLSKLNRDAEAQAMKAAADKKLADGHVTSLKGK